MMFFEELAQIRKVSVELGYFSWTSDKYQKDIFEFIENSRNRGHGIIEVGTYKGGLTAQLALYCKKFGWPLWTMDLSPDFLELAAGHLSKVGLGDGVVFHLGPLDLFGSAVTLTERPVLIILDGDHSYNAVVKDIHSLYHLSALPYAAAFHDYSLRHPTSDERVSEAISDSFGDWPVRLIGTPVDDTGTFPTKERPYEDGHWWEIPGSEGALVELPPSLSSGDKLADHIYGLQPPETATAGFKVHLMSCS